MLKESGSLEADAHLVLLIYRPTDDGNGEERKNDSTASQEDGVEILIAKQRSGPVGSQGVKFDKDLIAFTGE